MDAQTHRETGLAGAEAGSYRELLAIAVPLMISAGTQSLMHVIDRVFLTWYSGDALAAALPAGILYWTCLSLPFAVASYVNTFVAQYEGAGRPERVAASVWQGIYFAAVAGLVLTLAAPWADSLFGAIGHGTAIAEQEAIYFRWLSWGSPAALLHVVLSAFFSGRGQTRVVLWVNVVCVAINAVLDYIFIFGWGPIPQWGIAGAAMTDVFGEVLATTIFAGLLCRRSIRLRYPLATAWRWDRRLTWDLLRFGGPSGLQMLIDVGGFTVFMIIIGWIGPTELKATNIAFNLNTLAFIPIIGVGIAVSTLVGQRIGEGRPELAVRSTHRGFVLAGAYMLVFAAIYTGMPDLLIAMYEWRSRDADFSTVHETIVVLLRFVAVYSFFDAMAIVYGSAIRGAGDTRFSLFVAFLGAWLLLVTPTYAVWKWYGPNLFWSWTFCAIYVVVLGFAFLARFRAGYWRTMTVMEPAPSDLAEPVAHPAQTLVVPEPASVT
jgi:MATE family multidrug resistance protein